MMRIRKWTNGTDMQAGHGAADYFVDDPEGVGQAVVQRLRLLAGEWFLDLKAGTPYVGGVFGKHTMRTFNSVIRDRILGTEGVTAITRYDSSFDGDTRKVTISVEIDTEYGPTTVQEVL